MADNFTQIKNELIRSADLTPKERAVLFVLISYSDYDKIFISQAKLAKQSGMKRKSVIKAVEGLRNKKLITAKIKTDRSTLVYELDDSVVVQKTDKVKKVVSKKDNGCPEMTQGVVSKLDTNNTKSNNTNLIIEEVKKKTVAAGKDLAKDKIPYKEILDYLNSKAQLPRGFKPSNGSNKFISSRWNEGFRVTDFKTVIDNKVSDWLGDAKWGKFLRPETLFGTKFQSYLNQQAVNKPITSARRIIT